MFLHTQQIPSLGANRKLTQERALVGAWGPPPSHLLFIVTEALLWAGSGLDTLDRDPAHSLVTPRREEAGNRASVPGEGRLTAWSGDTQAGPPRPITPAQPWSCPFKRSDWAFRRAGPGRFPPRAPPAAAAGVLASRPRLRGQGAPAPPLTSQPPLRPPQPRSLCLAQPPHSPRRPSIGS